MEIKYFLLFLDICWKAQSYSTVFEAWYQHVEYITISFGLQPKHLLLGLIICINVFLFKLCQISRFDAEPCARCMRIHGITHCPPRCVCWTACWVNLSYIGLRHGSMKGFNADLWQMPVIITQKDHSHHTPKAATQIPFSSCGSFTVICLQFSKK